MNWTELLNTEINQTYGITAHLLDLVDEDNLEWKPNTGSNWFTTGQLIQHLTEACGTNIKGFVTGDWGTPIDAGASGASGGGLLPPAESFATASNLEAVRKQLEQDRKLSLEMLDQCSEEELAHKKVAAPWDPRKVALGHRLLAMVDHLKQHKGQLYYYLKLQGKPVNTTDLWPLP